MTNIIPSDGQLQKYKRQILGSKYGKKNYRRRF